MATFTIVRDVRVLDFTVQTTAVVPSNQGTALFVPNRCSARVYGGEIVSLMLYRVDAADMAEYSPDGAELAADFGGGEFRATNRGHLPEVVRDALTEVERIIR